MNISFYTARTGLIAQQQGMDIYANNIANVNTIGFKSLRPSFAECLYTHQHPGRDEWQTGHGQWLAKTDLMWNQGGITFTDQPLDLAMVENAFFMTMDGDGNTYLTRDGRFGISNLGTDANPDWTLVNGLGDFVLDHEGNRIQVTFETIMYRSEPVLDRDNNPVIGANGEPMVTRVRVYNAEEADIFLPTQDIDYAALYARIGTFNVPNNWGLDQAENNRFIVTGRSGLPVADYNMNNFIPMAVEMSAVDLAGEMVHVIETQRSYQLNARMIQTSDELMRIVNNLK